jgi:hypothetical protein
MYPLHTKGAEMRFSARGVRLAALAMLTLASTAGAAALGLLAPPPAYAQGCANGGCHGLYCLYMVSFSCSFPDRNTCSTSKCAFIGIE